MMEKITCTIEHITYQNPDNGYAVLQASVKGYREHQTLVGTTKALAYAIHNQTVQKRNTRLKERLHQS